MPEEDKRESSDPLLRSLDLEFAQKRGLWERDREKQRTIRLLAFSFLSLVILAALVALFLVFSRANEMREERTSSPSATAIPSPQSFP